MSKKSQTESKTAGKAGLEKVYPIPVLKITLREFAAIDYRIRASNEEEAGPLAREFRTTQAGLYKYVPYTASIPIEVAYENSHICAWARRVCAILENRHGTVPILDEAQIRESEVLAKEMLADPEALKRIRNKGVIRAAEMAMVQGVNSEHTISTPDRNRVMLKVLTLVIAFSVAIHDWAQPGNLPTRCHHQ
jgi:hypothetical protein